ncbi:hypothetical protein Uis1B_0897 [Bifidobacterium margollesii]|uniref:DUF202 domain-containing protein n=1 Tax=Bifidobacterium margollesii TaxID=2020964 RepID=A0A2N5JAR1_9BIFI|nr:DUF202 domain-containing protein [Bifidobacterium margollesii]PLS31261.1 hypothetical protein Uis1B_0897 [Bifidobacterium margollesii]
MKRFPGSVYDHGSEPDPRFTLANERTFLAWCRTSLALISIAVALDNISVRIDPTVKLAVVLTVMAMGIALPAAAWRDWAHNEKAMRVSAPLPSSLAQLLLAAGVTVCSAAMLIGMVMAW